MAARMHGYLQEGKKEPDPEKSNKKRREKSTPDRRVGWTKKSNQIYIEDLKAIRERRKLDGPKNSGRKCDHCIMEDHHLCGRVGCFCPCYKEYYNGQPYRQVVPTEREARHLE